MSVALREKFGEAVLDYVETTTPYYLVRADALHAIALHLRDAGFDSLMCLSAVDTLGMKAVTAPPPPDAPKTWKPPAPGEEIWVVYHLCSLATGEQCALKVALDRAAPSIASVADVWAVANWHEREAYDMFGIVFAGHPNLIRILCPDDWQGWPLRKDYVFPESYHGVPHRRSPSGAAFIDEEDSRAV